jgi:hypothetical protein
MNAMSCVNLKATWRGQLQQGGSTMAIQINISRPTTWIVIVSVIFAILALIGHFSRVQYLTQYQFWLAMIAYLSLLLGVLVKDL